METLLWAGRVLEVSGLNQIKFKLWAHSPRPMSDIRNLDKLSHQKRSLSVKTLTSSWWWIQAFQNFNFLLKAGIFFLATNTVTCFSWNNRLTYSLSRKYLPNTQVRITMICLSVIHSNKNGLPWKKQWAQSQLNCTNTFFSWDKYHTSVCNRNAFCILLTLSHRKLKYNLKEGTGLEFP